MPRGRLTVPVLTTHGSVFELPAGRLNGKVASTAPPVPVPERMVMLPLPLLLPRVEKAPPKVTSAISPSGAAGQASILKTW